MAADYVDIVLIPDDEPGVLARIGQALGGAGVNIEAVSAFTGQGKGVVHVVVGDRERTEEALRSGGFEPRATREVLMVDIVDRPGALGEVCARLWAAGVNIDQAYLATGTRLVLMVDDLERAREVVAEPS